MAGNTQSSVSLSHLVRYSVEVGIEPDRIMQFALRHMGANNWSSAERRQFREEVSTLIIRYRLAKKG